MYDDVKVVFYHGRNQEKYLFHFWFHTSFLDSNGTLVINKQMIEQAHKDKKCKHFDTNFQVKVELSRIEHSQMREMQLPQMPRKVKNKKKEKSEKKQKENEILIED